MKTVYTSGMIICVALAVSGGYLADQPGYGSLVSALIIAAFIIADQFDRPSRHQGSHRCAAPLSGGPEDQNDQ